jgi:hypothetical protein
MHGYESKAKGWQALDFGEASTIKMDQNATRRTSSETVGEDMTLSLFRVPNS